MATVGVEPLLFNKLLPLLLGVITTFYCFQLCLELLPVPFAGFAAAVLLNQSLWMGFDLVSGTARAFAYPLFVAFLYYWLQRRWLPLLLSIGLMGLFYPTCVLLAAGILFWQMLVSQKQGLNLDFLGLAGFGLTVAVVVGYAVEPSTYGPLISGAAARQMPEFLPGGRNYFFDDNPFLFWLTGSRSGWLPLLMPPLIWIGLFLPWLLQQKTRFPLAGMVPKKIGIFSTIIITSTGWFVLAHLLLFKLYLPSRFTNLSLRVVMALAAGMVVAIIWDKVSQLKKWQPLGWLLVGLLLLYPHVDGSFPRTSYRVIKDATIYEFFQQQPKDILIASLSDAANNIPTFSARKILVSREYGISYHQAYVQEFRQRAIDLITAQYTPDLTQVQNFIGKYGVDFWLLDRNGFKPEYLAGNTWLQQYQPVAGEALATLQGGVTPALALLEESCTILNAGDYTIMAADCIMKGNSRESNAGN
ncbi:hypothetical protein [[Phormidium] sp. ETS-05]|uniref:hypothetical protein n=1 Tax=[Phormidium] sp. ETS-05 TaxID=222819 RepID=UPI0018EF278C|nr:hypothetical protein [[Phormidium] sp. ETS-05]